MSRVLFLLGIFFSWVGPLFSHESQKSLSCEVWMTIFVHGIINPKPYISLGNIIRVMQDQIADSIYARSVHLIRKDPFFYQYHAMQEMGLHPIDLNCIQPGAAATAFANLYEQISAFNRTQSCTNHYYTFGWSGLLSSQLRLMESDIFYRHLVQEIQKYEAQGINPKIRVVAYSHGGHLALNLGVIHAYTDKKITIDQLVLVGLPVVGHTDYLINSPLFSTIYHIYSPGDRVQVTDFLSFSLSNRTFKSRATLQLPSKLIQVQLRCKRLARTKTAYSHPQYPRWLIRNADPGHTELYSFGWTYNYRKHLPFYPLPAAAYVGYIVQSLQEHPEIKNHAIVDIYPYKECMIVSNIEGTFNKTVNFISQEQHAALSAYALQYQPENFTQKTFEQRTAQAIAQAMQLS